MGNTSVTHNTLSSRSFFSPYRILSCFYVFVIIYLQTLWIVPLLKICYLILCSLYVHTCYMFACKELNYVACVVSGPSLWEPSCSSSGGSMVWHRMCWDTSLCCPTFCANICSLEALWVCSFNLSEPEVTQQLWLELLIILFWLRLLEFESFKFLIHFISIAPFIAGHWSSVGLRCGLSIAAQF